MTVVMFVAIKYNMKIYELHSLLFFKGLTPYMNSWLTRHGGSRIFKRGEGHKIHINSPQ